MKLMTDTCTISRDPLRLTDATLDAVTGQLTPNTSNDAIVYSGPCFITNLTKGTSTGPETGTEKSRLGFAVAIPWGDTTLEKGQIVTINTAGDVTLSGRKFTISAVLMGTFEVMHRASMDLIETDRD